MVKVNKIEDLTWGEIWGMHPLNCSERGDYGEVDQGTACAANYCWGLGLAYEEGKNIQDWIDEHCKDCEQLHGEVPVTK